MHAIFVFLKWFISLNMMISTSIHFHANCNISVFLMAELYYIVYKHHIFFIHSSLHGHVSWFHVLVIVKNTVMKAGVWVLYADLYPFDYKYEYKVVLFLVFGGTSILIFIVAGLIYISTNSVKVFHSLHRILTNIYYSFSWQYSFWLGWDGISV
jgi:hypothetical protein